MLRILTNVDKSYLTVLHIYFNLCVLRLSIFIHIQVFLCWKVGAGIIDLNNSRGQGAGAGQPWYNSWGNRSSSLSVSLWGWPFLPQELFLSQRVSLLNLREVLWSGLKAWQACLGMLWDGPAGTQEGKDDGMGLREHAWKERVRNDTLWLKGFSL